MIGLEVKRVSHRGTGVSKIKKVEIQRSIQRRGDGRENRLKVTNMRVKRGGGEMKESKMRKRIRQMRKI